jgi:dipeptidyl aminopeptidase/acylaminoacyl peptidase
MINAAHPSPHLAGRDLRYCMRVRTYTFLFASTVALAAGALISAQAPTQSTSKLTIDQLVKIKHPSGHEWTPDGKHVWWTYDDGGVNNVWTAPADGSGKPVALTNYPEGQSGNGGFWSPDGQTFFYQRGGGLLGVPVSGGEPRTAWPSAERGSGFTLSPDGARVAFVSRGSGGGGSELTVHTFATNADQQVARAQGNIGSVSWAPDGKRLAFITSTGGGRGGPGGGRGGRGRGAAMNPGEAQGGRGPANQTSELVVASIDGGNATTLVREDGPMQGASWSPDGATLTYSTGSGGTTIPHYSSPPEIGAKIIFVATERAPGESKSFAVAASGGTPRQMAAGGGRGFGRGGGGNWLDSTHTLSMRTSDGGKTRTWEAVDINGGEPKPIHQEHEDKFFSAVNATTSSISPDHKWLLITADSTGWDQIYVMPTSGGEPVQITRTPGEHWRAVWSHDSKKIAWDANTADAPGDRHIQFATIGDDPARATITTVTSGTGVNTAPEWSPDDSRILYQHTDAQNSPDLYVAAAAANAKPTRLTSSMPPEIDHSMFVPPQLIHYPGPDGKPVPAWLFVPKNLDRTKKHAAIVWIHPDGVNMNYNGFHPDRNEGVYYEFHQYLLQQGYVVIAPDYRGSIGYGRDWRNDVYMDVGGKDAADARMAYQYLKTLGYVDQQRVGVWGLSYGGFFTLIAVTREPTWFRAAVDVAGPADYHLYYEDPYHGGWTTSRIGTPEENPAVYDQANPQKDVAKIQTPLMVLAGTADVNVPFLNSAMLIDALLKAGKGPLTTFMMYPGEFHYFDRSFVVKDAWHRVDDFFREHLQPGK